jgi:hypothetical protein
MARKNPDEKRAYQAAWYQRNKERSQAKSRTWKEQHPGFHRAYILQTKFGITADDYARMLAEQEGRCFICGRHETSTMNGKIRSLAIDHNHKTGKVRHLLCAACNQAVGLIQENPLVAEKIAAYLRSENAD